MGLAITCAILFVLADVFLRYEEWMGRDDRPEHVAASIVWLGSLGALGISVAYEAGSWLLGLL